MEVVNALGRRKSAVARVFVSEGTGNRREAAGTNIDQMCCDLKCE